jgi:hypothetical protein
MFAPEVQAEKSIAALLLAREIRSLPPKEGQNGHTGMPGREMKRL